MLPRAVMFDLDNTLAVSKQPVSPAIAEALVRLLSRTNVAVISGGSLAQLESQAVAKLPPGAERSHLFLMPTSGAALFACENGQWSPVYQELLTNEDVSAITTALTEGATATGLVDLAHEQFGPYIENRGSQVSLSALGQQAPIGEKQAWDPTREKRERLHAAIAPLLPGYDVKIGGTTTIDVTKHGINKAYGVRQLAAHLSLPLESMLYVGDELRPGGNDDVVKLSGIPTRAVAGPDETLTVIEELLAG